MGFKSPAGWPPESLKRLKEIHDELTLINKEADRIIQLCDAGMERIKNVSTLAEAEGLEKVSLLVWRRKIQAIRRQKLLVHELEGMKQAELDLRAAGLKEVGFV